MGYSNVFGGRVFGSTLPMDECAVSKPEDIDKIVQRAKNEKAIASSVRVVMVRVRRVPFGATCGPAEPTLHWLFADSPAAVLTYPGWLLPPSQLLETKTQ